MASASKLNFPSDSAPEALCSVVKLLRLPYSRAYVEESMEATGAPQSLKGLTAAAPVLGLRANASRVSFEDLNVRGGALLISCDTGFGVLTEARESGFVVADRTGRRLVERGELATRYRGVAVRFESSPETATIERGRLLKLARERLGWMALGEGVFDRRPAHRVALVAALALALGSSWRQGATHGGLLVLLWVLSAMGGVASIAAARKSVGDSGTLSDFLCGGKWGCQSVLDSSFARPFGVDLAALGSAFFTAQLLVSAARPLDGASLAASLYVVAAPFAAVLLALQAYPIRKWCGLCLVADLSVLIAALASYLLSPLSLDGSSLLPLWLGCLALTYLLFVPMERARIRAGQLRLRLDDILESPYGQLAEAMSSPAIELSSIEPAWVWPSTSPELRVDLFLHPDCQACHGLVGPLRALIEEVGEVIEFRAHLPAKQPSDEVEAARLQALRRIACGAGAQAALAALKERPPVELTALDEWVSRWVAELEEQAESAQDATVRAKMAEVPVQRDFPTPAVYVSSAGGASVRLDLPFRHLRALLTSDRDVLRGALVRTGQPTLSTTPRVRP